MLVAIKKWSPRFSLSSILEDDVLTYRILLVSGAIIYLLLGYLYYNERLDGNGIFLINLFCGFVLLITAVLSFVSNRVKTSLRGVVGIMVYLVMLQSISEAVSVHYEINTTLGLVVTYFMCGLVFKQSRLLYHFLIITFLMVVASMFLFPEGELKKPLIISIFFSQGLITAIALGSKANMQNKLRKSSELFKNIFNESVDANFLADLETLLIKDCNAKAIAMFDVSTKEELLNLPCFRLQVQPFSDGEVIDVKKQIREYWGWSKELEYATKSGRKFIGNVEARVVAYEDKPHLLVRINDITEKKRLERLLLSEKQVLETAYAESNSELTLNLLLQKIEEIQPTWNGALLIANKEEKSLKWVAAPNLPKELLDELPVIPIHSDALPIGVAAVTKQVSSSVNLMAGPFDSKMTFIMGAHGFRALTAFPIFSNENNLLGVFCALSKTSKVPTPTETEIFERLVSMSGLIMEKDRAVTENKKAIEELHNKNRELQKSNSEIDSFVYSTSHDLRAPLLSVAGLIDLTDMQIEDPNVKVYFGLMKESIYKLDDTIKEIIEYYRNKKVEVTLADVNLAQLAREAFNNFRYMNEASDIDLFIDIDESISFQSDPKRIAVIFNNLLSNAVKFRDTKKEHKFIAIRSFASEEKVTIVVEDNGVGIEEHHLHKIFDMFYRANSTASGSGLGLYILKEVLAKLNGKISVESEPGRGTKFTLELLNQKNPNDVRKSLFVRAGSAR